MWIYTNDPSRQIGAVLRVTTEKNQMMPNDKEEKYFEILQAQETKLNKAFLLFILRIQRLNFLTHEGRQGNFLTGLFVHRDMNRFAGSDQFFFVIEDFVDKSK